MADNIIIRLLSGAAANVATDDIGGVHHQRVKIQHGADGAATDTSAASPLPVVQTGALGVTTVGGASAAVLGDTTANPTLVGVGAFGMRWDPRSSEWFRHGTPRELEVSDVLASAARTASVLSTQIKTRGARGVMFVINVTAVPGSGADLDLRVIAHAVSSQGWATTYTNLTIARAAGVARHYLACYPMGADVLSTRQKLAATPAIPSRVAAQVIHGDANSWTYSVGGVLLP